MANVDLYDSSYGHYALTAYGEIRRETYGEDYGQTSWVTTAESRGSRSFLSSPTNLQFWK